MQGAMYVNDELLCFADGAHCIIVSHHHLISSRGLHYCLHEDSQHPERFISSGKDFEAYLLYAAKVAGQV